MAGKRKDDDVEDHDLIDEGDDDEDEDDGGDAPDPRPQPGDTTLSFMDSDLVVNLAKKQRCTFVKARDAVLSALVEVVPKATSATEDAGMLTAHVGRKKVRGEALDPWIDAVVEKAASKL